MSLVGTVDQAEEKAAAKGLQCILPHPSMLFIDIDDAESRVRLSKALVTLQTTHPEIRIVREGPSQSGAPGRCHVVVDIGRPVVSELERVALQAILGSDPVREALSWMHLQQGTTNVSRFFEKMGMPIQFEETF